MRVIAAATLILMPLAAAASQPQAQPQAPRIQAAPRDAQAAKPICDRFGRVEQARGRVVLRQPSASAQRLDQLPPGDLSLTVMRSVNGCVEPVIVREGYGDPAFRNGRPPRR